MPHYLSSLYISLAVSLYNHGACPCLLRPVQSGQRYSATSSGMKPKVSTKYKEGPTRTMLAAAWYGAEVSTTSLPHG